ncbi:MULTISPECIES: histidine phosphatase family protein [unclassified Moraxella]|uniref:SixA phosphatase family protein n=1 Tax=unclassified Moraxella TaxID=2685852 RepID=UPI00359D2FB7
MTMKLIFVRHGQAVPHHDDAGRDLTDFGRQQAKQTAEFLVGEGLIDVIITSPYNRANQTASIIFDELVVAGQEPDFITVNRITPDDNPKIGINDIEYALHHKYGTQMDGLTVAIVCHMPIVAHMTAILEGDCPSHFELAECRVLQAEIIAEGLAHQIRRFVPIQPE